MTDHDDTFRRAALAPLIAAEEFRPPSTAVTVEVGALSRQGRARAVNDDHYLVIRLGRHQETLATSLSAAEVPPRFEEYGYALFVADGLGPGGTGSVASRVALSTIANLTLHSGRWNLRIDPGTVWEILERAEYLYATADAAVTDRRIATPALAGMSTGLTGIYSAGHDLFVAHVGHSRAYLFRDGALVRLTRDHTIAAGAPAKRQPAAADAPAAEPCHILTDGVGACPYPPSIEVEHFRLLNGDCVMLCTNGLTDAVADGQIADLLASRRRPADQCAALVDLASAADGDNITVAIAQYQVPES